MKSKLYIFALLTLLVANCTREPLPEPEKEEAKIVTISASIPPETRVLYDDSDRSLAWQTGDTLLLAGYDGTTYKGSKKFHWTGGKNFQGTEVPGATTYKAYYLAKGITLDETTGEVRLPADFWKQTQNGNNSTAHLRNKLLLFDENANPITQRFSLALKSSIIKLNLTGIPEDAGELYQLIYTVETASGVFESVSLDVTGVTFSADLNNITAFLSFDPTEMTNIAANGKVIISLYGEKSYMWKIDAVTQEKTYAAGKRYTGAVSSGWIEIINPLRYVARYNVNPAGTGFVEDLTACEGSGYFNWNQASVISLPGYHLPSQKEWRGIAPEAYGYVLFKTTVDKNNITEYVTVRNQDITMTCDYRNVGTQTNPAPSYALRYKGNDNMLSAWKYEYNYDTNLEHTHLKVTCRNVVPSIPIDTIAQYTFWITNNKNDIVRYFPASGWVTSGHPNVVGTGGYFWSSTQYRPDKYDNLFYSMYFTPTVVQFNRNDKLLEYSVRLFVNTD